MTQFDAKKLAEAQKQQTKTPVKPKDEKKKKDQKPKEAKSEEPAELPMKQNWP